MAVTADEISKLRRNNSLLKKSLSKCKNLRAEQTRVFGEREAELGRVNTGLERELLHLQEESRERMSLQRRERVELEKRHATELEESRREIVELERRHAEDIEARQIENTRKLQERMQQLEQEHTSRFSRAITRVQEDLRQRQLEVDRLRARLRYLDGDTHREETTRALESGMFSDNNDSIDIDGYRRRARLEESLVRRRDISAKPEVVIFDVMEKAELDLAKRRISELEGLVLKFIVTNLRDNIFSRNNFVEKFSLEPNNDLRDKDSIIRAAMQMLDDMSSHKLCVSEDVVAIPAADHDISSREDLIAAISRFISPEDSSLPPPPPSRDRDDRGESLNKENKFSKNKENKLSKNKENKFSKDKENKFSKDSQRIVNSLEKSSIFKTPSSGLRNNFKSK